MWFMLTLHNGRATALQRREFVEFKGQVFRIGEIPIANPVLILLKKRVTRDGPPRLNCLQKVAYRIQLET
jgi:hypothetical protein